MKITIYSTSVCPPCHALAGWLDAQNITYNKKIIDRDPQLMSEFMSVSDGLIAVPFTVIETGDGQVVNISGFDQKKFKQVLGV